MTVSRRIILMWVSAAGAAGCGSRGALGYVGAATCAQCHQPETRAWLGSDHARAMHDASDSAVQGDFADRMLIYYGDTVRFRHQNGHPVVTIGGVDGRPRDYPLLYTFGFYPLQQYLVAFPRGRLQALPVAWDTRPAVAGGQRWFHLYPNEPIRAGDELYWTGRAQNWNYMCAECHSTDLRKKYVASADSFATTWREINVACEACHGPGSRHVTAARRVMQGGNWRDSTPLGFPVRFDERAGVVWHWDSVADRPRRSSPPPRLPARARNLRPLPCASQPGVAELHLRSPAARHPSPGSARTGVVLPGRPDRRRGV